MAHGHAPLYGLEPDLFAQPLVCSATIGEQSSQHGRADHLAKRRLRHSIFSDCDGSGYPEHNGEPKIAQGGEPCANRGEHVTTNSVMVFMRNPPCLHSKVRDPRVVGAVSATEAEADDLARSMRPGLERGAGCRPAPCHRMQGGSCGGVQTVDANHSMLPALSFRSWRVCS
jgi:hypothetical protein